MIIIFHGDKNLMLKINDEATAISLRVRMCVHLVAKLNLLVSMVMYVYAIAQVLYWS